MSEDVCLIDGCRSMDEVDSFRRLSDNLTIICVHASRKDRFDRIMARGREDVPKDMEEFDSRDRKELDWGLGDIIALSDIVISNDSDIATFRLKIEAAFRKLNLECQ